MQEMAKILNSPEARAFRQQHLDSPEARAAREHLFSDEARRIVEHLRSPEARVRFEELQRPEARRFFEQMKAPENRRFYEQTMRYAGEGGARAAADSAGLSFPAGLPWSLPIDVSAGTVRAAREAAGTAQAAAFRENAARLAGSAGISLPMEAGLAAQVAASKRFLAPSIRDAAAATAGLPVGDIRREFAETLAQAQRLLSDPNFRRMLETVDTESLVAEGLEVAEQEEVGEETVGGPTVEEIDVLLGPDADVEILVPWVNYAFILFGVAWLVAGGSPEFIQYKEPLGDILTRLGLLSKALEMLLKSRDREG